MWLLDHMLGRAIRDGALELVDPRGRIRHYGMADAPALRIRIADEQTAYRIGSNPSLGAGEAYMDGRLTVENGTIVDLLDLVTRNLRWDRANRLRVSLWKQQRLAAWIDERNEKRRARRNVAHHYDLDDRLYSLFLDSERQYSCAYFRPGNDGPDSDLEQAQRDKMAHIVAKLRLEPGMRVLDIGCGWGGMARHIHAVSGAEVLGITLSTEQLAYAQQRAEALGIADRVRYALLDYRDVKGQFDRIVSVGMFEHVGTPNYRTFFRCCHNLLNENGVMLLHTIWRAGGPGVTDKWTIKYIFPGGYNPALSETVAASEKSRLIATDVETLRLHYALTLRQWYANTLAHESEIVAMMGARFFRMWCFYLAGATAAFESGGMGNYQIQFTRSRHALPLTRDYLAEAERRYL
jgi:cyclopropane-fatty-acyl-phospholipid synthase